MSTDAPLYDAPAPATPPDDTPQTPPAAALAHLAEGVVVTDAAGRIAYVNEAAVRLHGGVRLGVGPEEYAEAYRLLTEDGRPFPSTELPLARAVMRGETVVDARWRVRREDGSEVLAVGSARPLVGLDGHRLGAVLTVRDETARVAAEAALAASEERAQLALDAARLGTFEWDLAADTHVWDERTREIYGLTSEEPASLARLEALIHPEDQEAARAAFAGLVPAGAGPTRLTASYRVVRPDGTVRWVEIHGRVHFSPAEPDDTGAGPTLRPRRLVGTVRDVSEQRQAEEDQRFLLDLSARVGRLADPTAIGRVAVRALGEFLGLSRCFLCDVDMAREVYVIRGMDYDAGGPDGTPNPSSVGEWPVGVFGPHVRADALAGRATVVADTRADPRTAPHHATVYGPQRVGAYVHLPLRRAGEWIAALLLNAAGPRAWADREVALAHAVAERACSAIEAARLVAAERSAHAAAAEANARLSEQARELALANDQLQETATAMEAQALELEQTMAQLEARTEEAEVARRAAEAERARAEGILEGMADAFFALDADFRVTAVNRAMERASKLRRDALVGRPFRALFPGAAGTAFERHYRQVAAERVEAHFTHDYSDGRLDLVIEVDAYPGPDGGVAVFWRDVTARARAEAALRASEARYRTLFERMDEGFCVVEVLFDGAGRPTDFRFTETNPAFVEQTGLAGATGRTVRELVPEIDPGWLEAYGRVAETGEPTRFQSRSGLTERWFDVYAFRAGEREERRVAILFTDISAARAAERERERLLRALEVERARLAEVFEQAPVAVTVLRGRVADDLVFELVNPRYLALIPAGRAPLGRALRDVLPEALRTVGPVLQRVLDTGEPFAASDYGVPLDRDNDGVPEEYYFNFVYHPLVEADGAVDGIIGVGVEVTESVRVRREVERARDRADRLQALTAALAGARTVDDVAAVIVAEAVAATGAATGMLAVRVPGTDEAVIVRQAGLYADLVTEWARFPLTRPGPAAECLRTREPQWAETRDEVLARYPQILEVWERLGTHALATVPLSVAGETIGAMSYTFTGPRAFPPEDRAFFIALGRQAAQAVERARLLDAERAAAAERERLLAAERRARTEAEAARERTARLQALTAALSTAPTLEGVSHAVVTHVTAAFGAAGTVIACLTPDGEHLEILGAVDMPDDVREAWRRFPLAAPVPLADVARTGEPLFLESPAAWAARYPHLVPTVAAVGHHANAVAPLVADGRIIGVLGAAFAQPRVFDAEDRAQVTAVAQQCALALERARLFEAERAARREAEAANRAKSDFLAVMSHELRTPLNAIGGYAQLIELGLRGPITAQQRADLERIQTSQRHLLGLINEVLNYARLETGTVRYDVRDVGVRDVVAEAEELVAPQARAKELALGVGDCAPGVAARADAEKLRQILVNLLSNAVKFTDAGGTIDVSCVVDGDRVRIRVRDTGIGIAADKLEAIFEPFVQVRADLTRTADGTGLGLAISRDLARGMGGDLTAESTLGRGSVFTVTLPRAA